MTPKKPATFRLDTGILNALDEIRQTRGISISDQLDRALLLWLEAMGVEVPASDRRNQMKPLETVSGIGEVSEEDGAVIGDRQYHLTVWQEMHRVTTMGDAPSEMVPGLKRIEGTVKFDPIEAFTLVGKSLVLSLDDGRKFPFFLRDSAGAIAARGPLE